MISKKMQGALNEQIKHEMYSSNLYLAMASYCSSIDLPGFAHWLKLQAKEELGHALKIYGYIIEQDGRATVSGIDEPPPDFGTPQKVFADVLAHEKKVTALIHKLAELAAGEKDFATGNMLQWFVNEQVEEEANAKAILAKLKMIGENKALVLMVDRELAARGA
jgi:ferritin